MWDITRIDIFNFRSYAGRHTFRFPTRAGLYNVTGENQANTRMGREGAGKSTIVEAICWCLTDRTTRGLSASDVVTWGKRGCWVKVWLQVGDRQLQVRRSKAPNSLTLNNTDIAQKELDKQVRLSPPQLVRSVMMPQFGDHFFDMKPNAKLKLFSDILDLDYWLDKAKETADLLKVIETDQSHIEKFMENIRGKITVHEEALRQAREDSKLWDISQHNELARKYARQKGVKKSLEQLNSQHTAYKDRRNELGRIFTGFNVKMEDARDRIEKRQNHYHEVHTERALQQAKLPGLRLQLAVFEKMGPTCGTCKQPVSRTHVHGEEKVINNQIDGVKELIEFTTGKLLNAEAKLDIAKANLKDIEQQLSDHNRKLRECEAMLTQTEERLNAQEKELGSINIEIERANDTENPHHADILRNKAELRAARDKLNKKGVQLDELSEDHEATKFWVGAFKRVRLFIVEETLQQLELEVNNSLSALGLTDWRIEFDVERENKAGGVTKGFIVMIYPPGIEKPIRYEAWSGSETQRLRLAGDLGLANLIMERAGLVGAVEFYDEPTQHMGPEGRTDLAELLAQRAKESGRRIFYIDHNNLSFGGFAGTYVAVKGERGSHLETVDE